MNWYKNRRYILTDDPPPHTPSFQYRKKIVFTDKVLQSEYTNNTKAIYWSIKWHNVKFVLNDLRRSEWNKKLPSK